MPTAKDITLRSDWPPIFPDLCVVCGQGAPDARVKVPARESQPLLSFFVPILILFGWRSWSVPACSDCRKRFYLQRWGRDALCWALIVGAVFLIAPHFGRIGEPIRRIVVGALVLVALLPFWLFEVFWPRCFEITARYDSVEYRFTHEGTAQAFLGLNREALLRSDLKSETED
jgi:hypothetical protein